MRKSGVFCKGLAVCLLCVLALTVCSRLPAGGRGVSGETLPTLFFGEAVISPATGSSATAEDGARALTLPICLSGVPDGGFCGLLFWVEIQGRANATSVSRGTQVAAVAGMGAPTLTWQTYPAEGGGEICGILFDSKENFAVAEGGELCRVTLTVPPETQEITLSLTAGEGSMAKLGADGEIVSLEVSASLPYYICVPTQNGDGEITPAETQPPETQEPPTADTQTTPSTSPHAPISPAATTLVGVQSTASQSRRQGDITYAVRFLFMTGAGGETPIAESAAVCLAGGGVLKLSLHTKDFVLSNTLNGQEKVYPPKAGARWVTYTFEGLSLAGEYVFWVYDGGRGAATCVTFRDGVLRRHDSP